LCPNPFSRFSTSTTPNRANSINSLAFAVGLGVPFKKLARGLSKTESKSFLSSPNIAASDLDLRTATGEGAGDLPPPFFLLKGEVKF